MAEFDELNRTDEETELSDEQIQYKPDDDFFGSDYAAKTSTTMAASHNPFNSESQQPDISWIIDNPTDTTLSTTTFDDNTLDELTSEPKTTSFDDLFTNQPDTNELESYSTSNFPPTANKLLYDDANRPPSENSLSFNMFTNSVSSSSTPTTDINRYTSTENLSPLQAFNVRRQQEIAEMEVIEKQKIEELRQQGKKELERWYEDRRLRMEQKRQSMKQEQDDTLTQALQKSDKETCDWAKIIRFLDFSQGTQITKQKRDINRMRAVIIQAKRDKEGRKSENGV